MLPTKSGNANAITKEKISYAWITFNVQIFFMFVAVYSVFHLYTNKMPNIYLKYNSTNLVGD